MVSLLLIIPWIIFGFKHPNLNLFGLNQTKKSLTFLFFVELTFFLILYFTLPEPNSKVAGLQSFAWNYFYAYYAKAIIPTWLISESIDGNLGDKIDLNYEYVYLIVSLIMDYLILLIISPNIKKIWKRRKASA
ncbi:hypothetical protein SAMN05444278_1274 [Psychroflexus salarius]|uniref:Uncharacterized protein n=1 Tax=Psychroflexus salarius TaxID=1155689 RepID=A0A1M4YFI4_9FLAO|nr:hypothetical protein [Psychroflexus salarius]SHF04226.1 hypothetical protein SAMN05444278_1274 [Psychroflexus salarius]